MEVSKVFILAVRNLHQQAPIFIENIKFQNVKLSLDQIRFLWDGFILEFLLGGGLTGAGEEVSACDRYHFRWIPPSDVNSHVVTDGSDLWPIYWSLRLRIGLTGNAPDALLEDVKGV